MYIYSEANKYRRYFRLFQFDLLGGRSAHEQTSEYTVLSRFSWKLAHKPTRYCIAVYFPRHSHFPIHVNKSNYYVLSHRARRAFQPLVDIFTILYTVAEHMSIESTRFPIHSFPCMHFGAETFLLILILLRRIPFSFGFPPIIYGSLRYVCIDISVCHTRKRTIRPVQFSLSSLL